MIRVLLAVNDARLADHLSGLIAESDELQITSTVRDPQELRGALPLSEADAVLVHDRLGALPSIEVVRELTVAQPDLGLVMIVAEGSPDLLRSGMQAGARDVLADPIGLEQLESSVMAAAAWTHAVRRRAARDADGELIGMGRVVAVVGAKGGVGTTTIATHLALAARELGEASVCLVEYDLQAGDLRAYLDLPYRRSVVDLVPVADELTSRHLQESLYTHQSGMRVLLGPQEGEQAEEVRASAARNILTAIRTREDLTIVDAGATLTEASAIAVEMADTVLIVTTPDVVSLRGVNRVCSLWDRLKVEPAEVGVLLNRTSRKLEVQPDLARRVVPAPVLETTVPADFFSLEAAANTGIPATDAASDAILRPMAAVLGEISALPPKEAASSRADRARSITARLAGESGQATVELMGGLGILILLMLCAWQLVLVGATFVLAGHAARTGARALAVGDPVASAAKADLPGPWQDGTTVTESRVVEGTQEVTVEVPVPLLLPGLLKALSIGSSSRTVIEDQLLQGEQQGWTTFGGPLSGIPVVANSGGMPFTGITDVSRLDQGIDLTASGFYSPVNGKVVFSEQIDPGWKGGGYIAIQDSSNPGLVYYFAEGIAPTVFQGETVIKGQPIGAPVTNPYNFTVGNIEFGRANPASPGQPLAQVISDPAAMVMAMYNWLRSLGVPPARDLSNAGYS